VAWRNLESVGATKYQCGWCGNVVASVVGYFTGQATPKIYICPSCESPTLFQNGAQVPGVSPGEEVAHLPPDVDALYKESRKCCGASCYTASVLICRKLLMNIAVAQGAEPGQTFISYVEHLAKSGYVPPNGKGWVDHIRKKGNEATHEIALMSQVDANELLAFAEMLLKLIYEFPNRVPKASS
jgi:hypothetical protein